MWACHDLLTFSSSLGLLVSWFLLPDRFARRRSAFITLVDRARDEKRFVLAKLPKATARFAVQGR
jgi:hypothetical protein